MKLHPLEQIAKRHFGVTDNLEETGYVLSDGTFLDLSGRHHAIGYERRGDRFVPKKRQPDYLYGQRNTDHRELPGEIQDALGTEGGSQTMSAFLRETGALRFMPGTGFLAYRMPTVESVARVIREWHHAFGREVFYVDVVTPDGDRESVEFEEPSLEEVMEFLESKFGGVSMGASRRMPPDLRSFGRELRKLINSGPVFSILEHGDWGAGGCWILAQTLVDYLGAPAELVAISERRFEEEILTPVSHVAVRYGDMYIDYNGAQTEEEFLENLVDEGYEDPEIHDWDAEFEEIARRKGIPCDPRGRKELMKHLARRFGS